MPEHHAAFELRAGERIATIAEELAELGGLEPEPEELIATLERLTMPAWTGPTQGQWPRPSRLLHGR